MPPYTMVAVRFWIGFGIVALVFFKKLRKTNLQIIKYAAIIGALGFLIFFFITKGMRESSATNAGFITSTAIIMAPYINAILLRRRPHNKIILCSIVAFAGICLMTIKDNMSFSTADFYIFLNACAYAAYIIAIDRFTHREDPLLIGIYQVGFTALFMTILLFFTETPSLPSDSWGWSCLLMMAILSTAFGFVAQTLAQGYSSTEHASISFALEPVSAGFFGFLVLGEVLTPISYIGAVLILVAVVIMAKMPDEETN